MKQKVRNLSLIALLMVIAISGCKKDNPAPESPMVSVGKQINYFKIVSPSVTGVIDTVNRTISFAVPANTDVTALTTDISLAAGHSISPASGVAQNFTNPVTYTVTRPDNTKTTWTVTVLVSTDVIIDQDITADATWSANHTYIIQGNIYVDNAILTIEPGTVIKFESGASLNIGYSSNATLIATGTSVNPITLTSTSSTPSAGAWQGLFFYQFTQSTSVLSYCNILFAGSDSYYGAVNLMGCNLPMNNCSVVNSGSYGIYTEYNNNKGGFVSFSNNTINTTAKYGIVIDAQKLSTIGTGNTFTNAKGVSIGGSYDSNTAQTWKNLGVPYFVDHELYIDGSLTIEPGTVFMFDAGGHVTVGYSASTTFVADGGSASTPITFTSSALSPSAGAWEGISFYDYTQTNSKMNYCVVDYAGSNAYYGAVNLFGGSSIIFTNNNVRNSANYGIYLEYGSGNESGFQSFTNNMVNTCANHVVRISTLHLPDLGSSNTFTAAPGKGIEFSGHAQYANPVTWKKQSANFYVASGEADIDGELTIEAGSTFLFENDSYFYFGYNASTKITAVGTSNNPITFTSAASSPVAGSWKGFVFDQYTQSNSSLNYCAFQYTGMNGVPAIYTYATFSVSNTTIDNFNSTHAAEYFTGITVPSGTGNNFTWFAN